VVGIFFVNGWDYIALNSTVQAHITQRPLKKTENCTHTHARTGLPVLRFTERSKTTTAKEAKAGTTHIEEGSPVENSAIASTRMNDPEKGRFHPNANQKEQNESRATQWTSTRY
jgi:hypothetical protein